MESATETILSNLLEKGETSFGVRNCYRWNFLVTEGFGKPKGDAMGMVQCCVTVFYCAKTEYSARAS